MLSTRGDSAHESPVSILGVLQLALESPDPCRLYRSERAGSTNGSHCWLFDDVYALPFTPAYARSRRPAS